MATPDSDQGIVKAICFPRAARQRRLAHRMRNLAAEAPEYAWPEFKVRAQAAYQAPSRAIARSSRRRWRSIKGAESEVGSLLP